MAKRQPRKGTTTTFSISVDAATKLALRALADRDFDGNLSALIADFAADARRRMAAGTYLEQSKLAALTRDEAQNLQDEIETQLASPTKRSKRRTAA